jgi:hypothetical protein
MIVMGPNELGGTTLLPGDDVQDQPPCVVIFAEDEIEPDD